MNYIKEWNKRIDKFPENYSKSIVDLRHFVDEILNRDYIYIDFNDVDIVIDFGKLCNHIEGKLAGTPIVFSFTQKYIITLIFGIKDKNTESRYFNEVFLMVARKTFGKSTFMAVLMLYGLIMDCENGAQIWTLATVLSQASIVYDKAVIMAKKSPAIWKLVRTRKDKDGIQILEFVLTNSFMKAGSKDVDTKDGLNPHFCCIDEVHAIKKRNIYDVMKSAMGDRDQPLMLSITTNGFERDNLFDSMYKISKKTLRNEMPDNNFLPIIFELDQEDDWKDQSKWIKPNPELNEKKVKYLQNQCIAATNNIELLPSFLAKHMNRAANASVIYLDLKDVSKCATDLHESEYFDKYAVGGVDLAETTDLCNATALIPINGKFVVLQRYFIAEKRLESLAKTDRKSYEHFEQTKALDIANQNIIEIVPGPFVKFEFVTNWFLWLVTVLNINFFRIGYDNWHSKEWANQMTKTGFFPHCVQKDKELQGVLLGVIQGPKSLHKATKESKVLFQDEFLKYSRHNGIFSWCCNNAAVRVDINNNIMPDKQRSNGRIDGYVGLVNALVAYNTCVELFESYQNFKYN